MSGSRSHIDSLYSITNAYKAWVDDWNHATWEHWEALLVQACRAGYVLEQQEAHRAGLWHVEESCVLCQTADQEALLCDLQANSSAYLAHPDAQVRCFADWTMEYAPACADCAWVW